jgi:hypothetical protein
MKRCRDESELGYADAGVNVMLAKMLALGGKVDEALVRLQSVVEPNETENVVEVLVHLGLFVEARELLDTLS